MDMRTLQRSIIPAAGIIYVIVGLLAHGGAVWAVGALILALIGVLSHAFVNGRPRA